MLILRVALLQLTAHGVDQEANAAKGESACRAARAMGADIAPFPEMWNIGYSSYWRRPEDPGDVWRAPSHWKDDDPGTDVGELRAGRNAWQTRAIGRDDPFVHRFRGLAAELDMAIGLTFLERWPGAPRNTVCLLDRHGQTVLVYAKVHTCCFSPPESDLTPGDSFPVCTLDTSAGQVKVGAMICFDREFPESARLLMLNGAEVVLIPNACPLEMHRIGQLRARAWENAIAVALANYAAPQQNGHSVSFDPIAFDGNGNSRDTLVIEAGGGEGIHLADFDLDALRAYREREAMGDAFRRPAVYGALTEPVAAPPFVRANRGGKSWRPTGR